MDYKKFFSRDADIVAKDILGRSLLRITKTESTSGKIIETGAYLDGNETPSRKGMKYAPGTVFLMPYRSFCLLNIATSREEYASCVEIRQVTLHDKILKGSGKIANFFKIAKDLNGILLGKEVQIIGEPEKEPNIKRISGDSDNCIGYFLVK